MTMTTSHSSRRHSPKHAPRRRVDFAGVALFVVGLVFAVISFWLVDARGASALVIVPSIVAATIGASHLTKREAPRG